MFRRPQINNYKWFTLNGQNHLQTALLLTFLGAYLDLVGWLIWGSASTLILQVVVTVLHLLAPSLPRTTV